MKEIIDMNFASLYPNLSISHDGVYDYHEILKEILEERRRVKLLKKRRLNLIKF